MKTKTTVLFLIMTLIALFPLQAQNDVKSFSMTEQQKIAENVNTLAEKYNITEFEVISLNEKISKLVNSLTTRLENSEESKNSKNEFSGLEDKELLGALKSRYAKHTNLGYKPAKIKMFGSVDNHDGYIRCIYTGRKIKSTYPANDDMNCEHSWPQSKGAVGAAKADLHHLFPTDSKSNSRRSNYDFGFVEKVKWENNGSKLGFNKIFEVRDDHKGNTARAIFYFSMVYGKAINATQEAALKKWNEMDPVDQAEIDRNTRVERLQNNRNPFVDMPELINHISDF